MPGLTPNGFEKPTLAEIKTEIEASFKALFGAFINLLPGSVFATFIGIFSEREASIWEVLEELHNSAWPDTANGTDLDNAVGYNGITRLQATSSTQPGQLLFGDPGTLVDVGTQFSVQGNPQAVFVTQGATTLEAGEDAQQEVTFTAVPDAGSFTLTFRGVTTAPIPANALAADVEAALRALPYAGAVVVTGDFATGFVVDFAGAQGKQPQPALGVSSALTETGTPISATVAVLETGEAQAQVELIASKTGPVDAPVGTLTVIDTPVAGLTGTLNMQPTVLGRNRETDAELRLRRRNTITVAGNATVEAIRSRLLNLEGVRNVFIFENELLTTDGDGRPGKSYEIVVDGGEDAAIAEAVWQSKPAGIETFGSVSATVTDSQGVLRPVKYSRPTPVRIYLSVDLKTDTTFPANGLSTVRELLLEYFAELGIGTDVVVYPRLVAQLIAVPGITDLGIRINTAPVSTTPNDTPQDDNIIIAPFAVASLVNADLNLNVLP